MPTILKQLAQQGTSVLRAQNSQLKSLVQPLEEATLVQHRSLVTMPQTLMAASLVTLVNSVLKELEFHALARQVLLALAFRWISRAICALPVNTFSVLVAQTAL